ncbi:MAG: hypothetical protein ACYTEZ_12710 [Planctomycetota bacterium]
MRAALLFLLLTTCVACRSPRRERPPRDYLSVNRSSWSFLKETARDSRRLRKQNLKRTLDFKGRAPFNRRQHKEGFKFAAGAFWTGTVREWKDLRPKLEQELKTREERARSIRFGHLDRGE